MVLFSTAYFPPIQYFTKIIGQKEIYIENYENYSKQSYRNRCEILSANGKLSITIPVIKKKTKTLTKDILIDYTTNWQKNHLKTIESAYRSSPFYDFFIDEIIIFLEKKFKFLLDYNSQIINTINDFIGISPKIINTKSFIPINQSKFKDYRFCIHPKKNKLHKNSCQTPLKVSDSFLNIEKPYLQVFSEKFDFVPNLSILDLIMNLGQESISYL